MILRERHGTRAARRRWWWIGETGAPSVTLCWWTYAFGTMEGSSESTNTVNRRWLAGWLVGCDCDANITPAVNDECGIDVWTGDSFWSALELGGAWWWWWGPRKGTTDNQFDLSWHHHHHRNGTRPTIGKLESVANLVRTQSNLDGLAAKWAVRMSLDFLNWLWWNLCYDSYRYSSITFWRWSH